MCVSRLQSYVFKFIERQQRRQDFCRGWQPDDRAEFIAQFKQFVIEQDIALAEWATRLEPEFREDLFKSAVEEEFSEVRKDLFEEMPLLRSALENGEEWSNELFETFYNRKWSDENE